MGDPFAYLANYFQSPAAGVVGLWVAAILTLVVYSYLFADTALFRLAEYVFVGVAAGYAVIIAWHGVLVPRAGAFWDAPRENLGLVVWLILGLLLFVRKVPSIDWLSKIPVAYLFGVGVALAIGGALAGSLIPQLGATIISLSPERWGGGRSGLEIALYQALLVAGTLGTLLYFYFTTGKGSPLPGVWVKIARLWGGLGKWMILITFGAFFASAVISRVSLLLGRLQFLAADWLGLIP